MPRTVRRAAFLTGPLTAIPTGLLALVLSTAAPVLAHGPAAELLTPSTAFTSWSGELLTWLALAAGAILYLAGVRSVNRAHPASRVPRRRVVTWLAGLAVLAVALGSAVDVYATSLFSVHMVQHLLLTMVAAPLLALGAPITLVLRATPAGLRRGRLLPVLHSRAVRMPSFPVVSWGLFTAVMWVSHFSPLFDAALEDPRVHLLEHGLFLAAAMLFWWPVVAADPVPWRMGHAGRVGYLLLQMPQNAFLGLAIYSAPGLLYPHYATLERAWGPAPLEDQRLAGAIMWAGGDLLFLVPLLLAVLAWFAAEEARGRAIDARLARERAARERAARERAAREGATRERLADG
jgi:cytochrome c oxidase assembly factor CtaG